MEHCPQQTGEINQWVNGIYTFPHGHDIGHLLQELDLMLALRSTNFLEWW